MKYLFALLICLPITLCAQSYSNPESVAFDPSNNRYLVSNSNNGQIIARASDGTLSVFKSGISPSPYGIEVLGNRVYACCQGFVYGYNLQTAALEFTVNTGATFLNGIASDGSQYLFVTDFNLKKIHRVNVASQTSNVMASGLVQSPNGMIYEATNNRLVFVNWGGNAPIKAMSLADSTVSVLTSTSYSNCDGIAKDNAGNYYVSSWGSSGIIKFNPDFTSPSVVFTGLSQPADIFYNSFTDTLAVPATGNDNVYFFDLNSEVVSSCSDLSATVNPASIAFSASIFTAVGDSSIAIPITNTSALGFAYPLAILLPETPLPSGMSFANTDEDYVVFASAWNPDSTATAHFNFSVTEAIPENYMFSFTLRLTNLSPSPIDTCYFDQTFTINLNPASPLATLEPVSSELTLYPNPSRGSFSIQSNRSDLVIEFIDAGGRLITATQTASGAYQLPQGIYFVRSSIPGGNYLKVQKLVVL